MTHTPNPWKCPQCAYPNPGDNACCDECGWDGFTTAAQREKEREMKTKTLVLTLEASRADTLEAMIDSVARSACDIANSTDDDNAHIWVHDDSEADQAYNPYKTK